MITSKAGCRALGQQNERPLHLAMLRCPGHARSPGVGLVLRGDNAPTDDGDSYWEGKTATPHHHSVNRAVCERWAGQGRAGICAGGGFRNKRVRGGKNNLSSSPSTYIYFLLVGGDCTPGNISLAAKKADAGCEGAMGESAEGEELGRVDVVIDEVRIASSGNVNKTATDRPVASAKFEALLQEQIE